jgi:carbon storage regulator
MTGNGNSMLVLNRKPHERIIIDQSIEIVVLEVRGNRVRLGINAPPEVSILRGELERDEPVPKQAAETLLAGNALIAPPSNLTDLREDWS